MPVNPPTLAALMLVLILVAGCAGVQQPAPRIIVQDTQTIVRLDTDTSIKGPDDPGRYAEEVLWEKSTAAGIRGRRNCHACPNCEGCVFASVAEGARCVRSHETSRKWPRGHGG